MTKPRSFISWVIVFVAGFVCGIVFSAWKLDTRVNPVESTVQTSMNHRKDDLRTRIAGLEKMLAASPDNVQVLIQLGNDYSDAGNHAKAVETYQRVLQIDPRNADVLTDMGVSYRKLGKPEDAVASFQRALEIDPNHAISLFNLGIVYRDDLKRPAEALKAWEAFLQKAGDAPHAVMVRPWVKQLKEKLEATGSGGK